jgi:hypothetical protein
MRGFVFMLEAVLAGIILVGFMLFLAHTVSSSMSSEERSFGSVLPELDQRGELSGPAYSGNYQTIEDLVSIYGYSDSVVICDSSGNCVGDVPQADKVWVSGYFLAGETVLDPREVRLYVWQE